MAFTQFRWDWNGWGGGPGVTLFRVAQNTDSTQTDSAAAAQKAFWEAIKGYLPTTVTLTCAPTVSVINDGDGSLVEQRSIATVPAVTTGTSPAVYTAVAGACLVWKTNTSTGRRLLQGRTFLVPLTSGAFDASGKVAVTVRNGILNAAATYITRVGTGVPGRPVVWHRPKPGVSGYSADVTNAQLNILGAELTRRRD